MNTTAAAIEAHVTVATIRTWCRHGVIAATKTAGRWIINTASLARRIAIGAMRARKQEATPMIDLDATYTATIPGLDGPQTITPAVKRRTARATGENLIVVTGLPALFADQLDAIQDAGDRGHALLLLHRAQIVISDTARDSWNTPISGTAARHGGLVRTTYVGGTPHITVDMVLDLAEQLRAQLSN